ncbi:mediator of RNA polymerase II transcription subunit 33A-like [Quercus robur]|uniref:mediator of RNA polymerase II transcription subunit 33A-like n=1 Tax=Quercus robur TaxID=38942 RepID=UPI002162C6B5|nr:mediator of RNA polymerase II transcription subunit 33A-like [Quercus robur]
MEQSNDWVQMVIEVTKDAQEKGSDPHVWAMQLSKFLNSEGVSLPSIEVAEALVSYICWDNNVPILWKFLDKALVLNIVPPLLVLTLFSTRVIPSRRHQPAAYRLFMELLKRHAFTLKSQIKGMNYQRVMQSIDTILQLSQIFGLKTSEAGTIVVELIFSLVWQLLDASLDDEGLLELTSEKRSRWATNSQDMEIDGHDKYDEKQSECHERMQKFNTLMAIELIGQFMQNKVTSRILNLARQNMSSHWKGFTQRLQLLQANSSALKNAEITPEALLQLASNSHIVSQEIRLKSRLNSNDIVVIGALASSTSLCNGASHSDHWLPLDLILEDAMDTKEVNVIGAIETITGLIKVLKAINCTSWHNTFLNLWIATLRLAQRGRDSIYTPRFRLDNRFCTLLCIITLVVADFIDEEESAPLDETEYGSTSSWKERSVPGKCRNELASSLQMLGDYKGLLIPLKSTVSAANQAAAKAMFYISGVDIENTNLECISMNHMPANCAGNMRHLIVEACIARNLLDTSAYFWPGYVNGKIDQIPVSLPGQVPGWPSLMQGELLTPVMIDALVSTPASSLAELEKIFEIAVNGSNEEKISVAKILCGASLIHGWKVQEHTADFIIRLLSLPAPADYSGRESHLIGYAHMLDILVLGITSLECLQLFSLHGLVPHLACSLMSICEVFGSCVSNELCTAATGEKISAHSVFSDAFTLLLRLWRFYHPPIKLRTGIVIQIEFFQTPEYLLLLRNFYLLSHGRNHQSRNKRRHKAVARSLSPHPILICTFPKMRDWYQQHSASVHSTLSGLVVEAHVHQIVDALLGMMFRGSQSLHSVSSGSSVRGPKDEDTFLRLNLPAWNILEAVPFAVEAALKACANGRLSPRELSTGLKMLCNFLPASLASIVSYFSSEVCRGVWKPVSMNGTDWPSPDANLSDVEEQIKKVVAATGVDVPSTASAGSSAPTLPLPLAAFVSLTLTFRAVESPLYLAIPALEFIAAGSPWPCMPIVASLWCQKVKRMFDYFVFSASRTVFLQNHSAVVKLLQSCFTATLGINSSPISSNGGVAVLLGNGLKFPFNDWSPVAPGILFLHAIRSLKGTILIAEDILSLLMHSVREIACSGLHRETLEKMKSTKNIVRSGNVSFAAALARVKLMASLGASLVYICGGFSLVQPLFKETLTSWLISPHSSELEGRSEGMVEVLMGYALAYFAFLCGAFGWGVDSASHASNWRHDILKGHMKFLANALDGKISLGCHRATWHVYVSEFLSLMTDCAPTWVLNTDVNALKSISRGLKQWNNEKLALALLVISGAGNMGAVAEFIIENAL